jgi:hypothetical protein
MSEHFNESHNLSLLLILWWKWYRESQKTQPLNAEEIDQRFISLIARSLVYFFLDGKITSSKWAPIIYGRTYSVDFRFLVTPWNFEERHKEFFWNYIKVTTRSAENLSGKPRWLFIRTKKRCLVGITCMVRDLIGSHTEPDLEDMTRDRQGRPLYAFVGYVSEDPTPFCIPAMNLELFAAPYLKFVSQKWQEVYADLGSNQAAPQDLKSEYEREFSLDELATPDSERNLMPIDQLIPASEDSIIFWNISDARNIWFTASQDDKPLYICFGNLTKRDVIDSKFMDAVLDEVTSYEEIKKVRQVRRPALSPLPQSEHQTASPHNLSNISNQPHQRDIDSQKEKYDENLWVSATVNLSKLGRQSIESIFGEQRARQWDDFVFNTLGQITRPVLGDEFVDEVYLQVAKIDEWEKRLKIARQEFLAELDRLKNDLRQLEKEIRKSYREREDFAAREKENVAAKIGRQIDRTTEKLREISQYLSQIKELRSRIKVHQTHARQSTQKFQPDSSFGFKEKEETVENEQLDRETQSKKSSPSKDVWEL